MIKKLIAAIDGSEHARKALDLAGDLAQKYDAELLVLHVVTDPTVPQGLREYARAEHLNESPQYLYRTIGEGLIREAVGRVRSKGLDRVSPIIEEGDPATTIVATAKARGADLIVMGSRGLSDIKGLLLGSVSHKVAHLAPCTCITVK